MKKLFVGMWLSLLCAGCVLVDMGYTENEDIRSSALNSARRVDITYSCAFDSLHQEYLGAPEISELIEQLREKMLETGLFRSVSYSENPTDYHVMFKFYLYGLTEKESSDSSFASIALGFAIPIWQDTHFDGSAQLYLKNIQVASSAKAEVLRCYKWLPCLPFGLIWNPWTGWNMVADGVLNALVNDIADEHRRQFLRKPVTNQ